MLPQANSRAGAEWHEGAAWEVGCIGGKAIRTKRVRVGKPSRVMVHQLHRHRKHGAGRQLPATQRYRLNGPAAQEHRRSWVKAKRFLERLGEIGERR